MPLIYGNVKDSTTGNVITTAVVTIPNYSVTMNSGAYTCTVPANTNHTVTASATGYVPQDAAVAVKLSSVQKNFLLVPV